jgi:uncharacterized protein
MVRKKINRKQFLNTAVSGIAGFGLLKSGFNIGTGIAPAGMRAIGKTTLKVTPICFGAPRTNEESLIRYAVDKGINFIDTGRSYGNGNNERLVGSAISGIRNNVVIQSKIRLEENELPAKGKGRKGADEIRAALSSKLEASLKALNTNYIDVLLYHDALDEALLFHPETMKFFSEMKQTGAIKAFGFSTHNDLMHLPERNNKEKFYDTIMVPFNHKGSFVHSVTGNYSEWDQNRLIGILGEAYKNGIGVIAMKTCSGGKYSPSEDTEPGYGEAVKWVLEHEFISSAAIAMASFEQVNEQLKLLGTI